MLGMNPNSLPACAVISLGSFDSEDVAPTSSSDCQRDVTMWAESMWCNSVGWMERGLIKINNLLVFISKCFSACKRFPLQTVISGFPTKVFYSFGISYTWTLFLLFSFKETFLQCSMLSFSKFCSILLREGYFCLMK